MFNTIKVNPSDAEIVQLVREGESDAFKLILERYEKRLVARVQKYVGSLDRAHDVAQAAFVQVYLMVVRNQPVCPDGQSIEPLLFKIAGHVAIDLSRQERAQARLGNHLAIFTHDEPRQPDAMMAAEEIEQDVHAAMEKLPPAVQQTASLHFMEGCSCDEVARITNSSVSAVRKRVFRARQALAKYLKHHSNGDTDGLQPSSER